MPVIRDKESRIVAKPEMVIHPREKWLWQNRSAIKSVKRGLKQAHAGRFTDGPHIKGAATRMQK